MGRVRDWPVPSGSRQDLDAPPRQGAWAPCGTVNPTRRIAPEPQQSPGDLVDDAHYGQHTLWGR